MIRGFSFPLDIPYVYFQSYDRSFGHIISLFIYFKCFLVKIGLLFTYLCFLICPMCYFDLCVILMNIGFHNSHIFFCINVFISLAAGLLRILCADSSIREQVKVFDGIPICLRWEMLPLKYVTLHQVGVQSLKQLSSRSTCLLCIIKRNIGKASLGFVHMNLDSF